MQKHLLTLILALFAFLGILSLHSGTVRAGDTLHPAQAPAGDDEGEGGTVGSSSIEDFYEGLGNGGYDAQHYTLDLDVDMDENIISGTVTMEAIATHDLTRFNLDFIGFDIAELTVNGTPAAFERETGDRELIITPAATIAEGERFTVSVTYSGQPGAETSTGRPSFQGGWHRFEDGVLVASEPAGSSRWYPLNDHPTDKATYDFEITVPEGWVVASNGVLESTIIEEDQTTFVWGHDYPMASYLVTVHIGDFTRTEDVTKSGVPIRNYFPSTLVERAVRTFAPTVEMFSLFEDLFGPYPFEVYGAVVADVNLGFALETQTLSMFGRNILSDAPFNEQIIAHELAHQWFGNGVTLGTWRDLWLNEGFASYAQILWVDHAYGRQAAEGQLRAWYEGLNTEEFETSRTAITADPPPDALFNQAVYIRGGWTLHALRMEVGDDAFFDIVQTYFERYNYGNATTPDFIAVAEEVSGRDLTDFFDGWLYQAEVPEIDIEGDLFPDG